MSITSLFDEIHKQPRRKRGEGKEVRVCVFCKKQFSFNRCNAGKKDRPGYFCSIKCRTSSAHEERTCEVCEKKFRFSRAYAKRRHKTGRFCSNECKGIAKRGVNNHHSSIFVDPIVIQSAEQKEVSRLNNLRNNKWYRTMALEKISILHDREIRCFNCDCDYLPALQINHIHGGGSKNKENGTFLYRKVLRLSDQQTKLQFNILCQVCNWCHFVSNKHHLNYKITFLGREERE